ncbi:MAG: hypothetical protein WD872_05985 [Pirellulaceae bacterium]
MQLPASIYAAVAVCAGALGLGALVWRRGAVRQTTLVPAWWWAVGAVVGWSATELAAARAGSPAPPWVEPLRFAAVTLSFCPVIAILGAKRPQHSAWNFVVVAFWGMVSLPAAETFFLQRGQRLEIGDARGWFLWMLICLGPINFVPTRQWLAALLVAAGQTLALSEILPLVRQPPFAGQYVAAVSLAVLGIALPRLPNRHRGASAYDRLWLDFRDTFGLFWALRLQERVNAVAATNQWAFELGWQGLIDRATGQPIEQVPPEVETTLRTTLKGLLRRFVSGDWIAKRLARSTT